MKKTVLRSISTFILMALFCAGYPVVSACTAEAQSPGAGGSPGRVITSGRVNTAGKFSFKYGVIEASIKLPQTRAGLWPAFWLLGAGYPEKTWPGCGEIDIMEMGHAEGLRLGISERFLTRGCHWGEITDGGHPSYTQTTAYSKNLQDDFHTYTMVWDAAYIRMFLDSSGDFDNETPYYEILIDAKEGEYPPGDYFHKPFFLLFNLAAGGIFPQIYSVEGVNALNRDNNYTASMYVDYVRVYDMAKNPVWQDEFDVFDEGKWNIEVNDDGGGNNELQSYRRENVSIGPEPASGKGCLVLTARR